MTVSEELERLDAERATPPATLYKFVVPDRLDVLENACIRFAPPLNTNDLFEVRQTFDMIAGPKMVSFFREVATGIDIEEPLTDALKEVGLGAISNEDAKALIRMMGFGDFEATTRAMLDRFIGAMPDLMNDPSRIGQLLNKMASNLLLLSLTEKMDSSPMWAHYAANSAGFVMAFDTTSPFFSRGEKSEFNGLHKVRYFDGRVGEILDDPHAALISKQADWSYEREWRLYVGPDKVTRAIQLGEDDVHLVTFPKEALQRVILGTRASAGLENEIRAVLNSNYANAELTRVVADRGKASLAEVSIS